MIPWLTGSWRSKPLNGIPDITCPLKGCHKSLAYDAIMYILETYHIFVLLQVVHKVCWIVIRFQSWELGAFWNRLGLDVLCKWKLWIFHQGCSRALSQVSHHSHHFSQFDFSFWPESLLHFFKRGGCCFGAFSWKPSKDEWSWVSPCSLIRVKWRFSISYHCYVSHRGPRVLLPYNNDLWVSIRWWRRNFERLLFVWGFFLLTSVFISSSAATCVAPPRSSMLIFHPNKG